MRFYYAIVTCYRLDGMGIESLLTLHCPQLSRPALGPTKPLIQWVLGFFPGGKVAGPWRWSPCPF